MKSAEGAWKVLRANNITLSSNTLNFDDLVWRTVVFDGEESYYQDSNIVWLEHNESKVLNSYLKHCYQLNPWKVSKCGTIERLYNDNLLQAEIVVPPLAEQKKIVARLEGFDKLCNSMTEGLPGEIALRKRQYEFYRDRLLTFKRAG